MEKRTELRVNWSGCTIAFGAGHFCDGEVPAGSPLSICGRHLIEAYRFCEDVLDIAAGSMDGDAKSDRFLRFNAWDNRVARTTGPPVVYYALMRSVIKIGTTTNLRQRMQTLKADDILATEPGGYEIEELRLKQFDHLRAPIARHRELFIPDEDLISHIEMLRRDALCAGPAAA